MDCKSRVISESMKKRPFCTQEHVAWSYNGDSNEFRDVLFTRQESILTQEGYSELNPAKQYKSLQLKNTKNHKTLHDPPTRSHRNSLKIKKRKVDVEWETIRKTNKKLKEDLYDMNNMIFFDTKSCSINISDNNKTDSTHKIYIPEFKVIDSSYYRDVEEDEMEENDEEMMYTEMHRPYELAESCDKFLDSGQGLPEELKGGLKITIKLPKTPDELPSLIH